MNMFMIVYKKVNIFCNLYCKLFIKVDLWKVLNIVYRLCV